MDPFTPKHLDDDMQRQVLTDKLRTLENDRLQQGIEIQALESMDELNDQERQELNVLKHACVRLDARINYHQSALDNVAGEAPAV